MIRSKVSEFLKGNTASRYQNVPVDVYEVEFHKKDITVGITARNQFESCV